MKKLFVHLSICLFIVSCAPSLYYQHYETELINNDDLTDGIVFDNNEVKVSYDFYNERGTSSFIFENLTDTDLIIDLAQTHLLINDFATTYYSGQSLTETNSTSTKKTYSYNFSDSYYQSNSNSNISTFFDAVSVLTNRSSQSSGSSFGGSSSKTTTNSLSTEIPQIRYVIVPAKAKKIIEGFDLNYTPYRECGLWRFPNKKSNRQLLFTKETSPYHYKNIISYSKLNSKVQNKIINEWYVKRIINYSDKEYTTYKQEEVCGENTGRYINVFDYSDVKSFYISYKKGYYPSKY